MRCEKIKHGRVEGIEINVDADKKKNVIMDVVKL